MIYSGNFKLINRLLNQSHLIFFILLASLVLAQQSIIDLQQTSNLKQICFSPSTIFVFFAHYLSRKSVITIPKTTLFLPIALKISTVILSEDSSAWRHATSKYKLLSKTKLENIVCTIRSHQTLDPHSSFFICILLTDIALRQYTYSQVESLPPSSTILKSSFLSILAPSRMQLIIRWKKVENIVTVLSSKSKILSILSHLTWRCYLFSFTWDEHALISTIYRSRTPSHSIRGDIPSQ